MLFQAETRHEKRPYSHSPRGVNAFGSTPKRVVSLFGRSLIMPGTTPAWTRTPCSQLDVLRSWQTGKPTDP